MSQRRMFSPQIVGSDDFLDMPLSSQALYFHLGMYADDDGFIHPKKIMRMVGGKDDDMIVLISKRFIVPFDNGVVVIKHWKMNNLVRKDWYRPTQYIEEKKQLFLKENNSYTLDNTQGVPIVNESLTTRQHRSGKEIEETRLPSAKRGKLLPTPSGSGTIKKPMSRFRGYDEDNPQEYTPVIDATTGENLHDNAPKGRDAVATRVSQYFFQRAGEYTGKKLINQGYAHAKKFSSQGEDVLKGVIDEFFDRNPTDKDAVNFYKCLNGKTINEYIAEQV